MFACQYFMGSNFNEFNCNGFNEDSSTVAINTKRVFQKVGKYFLSFQAST